MRKSLLKILRGTPATSPRARPTVEAQNGRLEMNPQRQSPLFASLSAELRILIYRAALADPYRLLHICHNIYRNEWGQIMESPQPHLAHIRCIDMDSEHPSWQHECYGNSVQIRSNLTTFIRRPVTGTNDTLLSFLLTCRLLCHEALPILYKENIFHFEGSPGLLAFKSCLPIVQWSSIRHIHIGTEYKFMANLQDTLWPGECHEGWKKCCNSLRELQNLDSLKLDIFIKAPRNGLNAQEIIDDTLLPILEPLKEVSARSFQVEINGEPSKRLLNYLGGTNFTLISRETPYNSSQYGARPQWKILY